jgi:DUF1365 family protein
MVVVQVPRKQRLLVKMDNQEDLAVEPVGAGQEGQPLHQAKVTMEALLQQPTVVVVVVVLVRQEATDLMLRQVPVV